MAILEKEIWITLNSMNIDYYENLKYQIPTYYNENNRRKLVKRGTKILVNVCDIKPGSATKLSTVCENENCDVKGGRISLNKPYFLIMRNRKNNNGKDICKKCSCRAGVVTRSLNIKYEDCLWSTEPKLAKSLKHPERGYNLTAGSNKRETFICPDCSYELTNKQVCNVVHQGLSCPRCGDGVSYPEKFVTAMFAQTQHVYETQISFEWSKGYVHKNKQLCGDKRYDGWLPYIKKTIEIHGMQHYESRSNRMPLADVKENDEIKMRLATENGEPCIVIDARKSDPEYIQRSIWNSELSNLVDLGNINWLKCHEYACNSLIKTACKLYTQGKSVAEIGLDLKLSECTIRRYLKQGRALHWCNYDVEEAKKKSSLIPEKSIMMLDLNEIYVNQFKSISEASRYLNKKPSHICSACKGKLKQAYGYKWMYKEDYEKYIAQAI